MLQWHSHPRKEKTRTIFALKVVCLLRNQPCPSALAQRDICQGILELSADATMGACLACLLWSFAQTDNKLFCPSINTYNNLFQRRAPNHRLSAVATRATKMNPETRVNLGQVGIKFPMRGKRWLGPAEHRNKLYFFAWGTPVMQASATPASAPCRFHAKIGWPRPDCIRH